MKAPRPLYLALAPYVDVRWRTVARMFVVIGVVVFVALSRSTRRGASTESFSEIMVFVSMVVVVVVFGCSTIARVAMTPWRV